MITVWGGTSRYLFDTLLNPDNPISLSLLIRYIPVSGTYSIKVRRRTEVIENAQYCDWDSLTRDISRITYSDIIVNSLFSWPSTKMALNWISKYKDEKSDVKVIYKVHDYYCICPSFTLQDCTHKYCGIRQDEIECNECVHTMGSNVLPYMFDPRYIRINNKPVLLIYKIALGDKAEYLRFVQKIQSIAKSNGLNGIYLISPIEDFMNDEKLEEVQEEYKLDALMEFHPIAGRKGWNQKQVEYMDKSCRSICYDVDDFVINRKYLRDTKANVFPGLFPDWDNSPRRYNRGAMILQSSPANYKQWLSDLIKWTKEHNKKDERFIFVNAWNEWAEGAHLEPDSYYGYAYLQNTRDALEENSLITKATEPIG